MNVAVKTWKPPNFKDKLENLLEERILLTTGLQEDETLRFKKVRNNVGDLLCKKHS